MPLIKSASRRAISANIRTERAAGRPENQAVAIAEATADRAKRKVRSDKGELRARHPSSHEEFHALGADKD